MGLARRRNRNIIMIVEEEMNKYRYNKFLMNFMDEIILLQKMVRGWLARISKRYLISLAKEGVERQNRVATFIDEDIKLAEKTMKEHKRMTSRYHELLRNQIEELEEQLEQTDKEARRKMG